MFGPYREIAAVSARWMLPVVLLSIPAMPALGQGPVRMARFASVSGHVEWRPSDSVPWSGALRNVPLREGAQIAVANGSRAVVQFDDGSDLVMARGAVVGLRTLYSDSDGEFTEITLRDGVASMRLRNNHSIYQVDTPFVSADAPGPSRFRVNDYNGVQVAVTAGSVTVDGDEGKATLTAHEYIDLHSAHQPYDVREEAPPTDSYDRWTNTVWDQEDRWWDSPGRRYCPQDVALVSDDLDSYGRWRHDPRWGEVWYPEVHERGWRPYHHGHWAWVDPYGWTWVGDEPWGWAPYHYGTWTDEPDGWAWCPGPATQYWSPAVVDYCRSGDNVAWCPLAPAEVVYPATISVGFSGGDWSAYFSIGGAACYYPEAPGRCYPRPWRNDYVNGVSFAVDFNNFESGGRLNRDRYFDHPWVPLNARYAAGASLAAVAAFGGAGAYRALPRGADPIFRHGRSIAAPAANFDPVAGPPAARPTRMAWTPTRRLQPTMAAARTALARPVFHLPGNPGSHAMVARARSLAVAGAGGAGARTPIARRGAPGAGGIAGRARAGGAVAAAGAAAAMRAASARRGALAGSGARMAGRAGAARIGASAALTREQRSAMQARRALGRPVGAAARPAASRMTAHAGAAGAAALAAHRAAAARTQPTGPAARRDAMAAHTAVGAARANAARIQAARAGGHAAARMQAARAGGHGAAGAAAMASANRARAAAARQPMRVAGRTQASAARAHQTGRPAAMAAAARRARTAVAGRPVRTAARPAARSASVFHRMAPARTNRPAASHVNRAPAHSFAAPRQFRAPARQAARPAPRFQAPARQFRAAASHYQAPPRQFSRPAPQFRAPARQPSRPAPQFNRPAPQFRAPQRSFAPHRQAAPARSAGPPPGNRGGGGNQQRRKR